MRMTEEEVRHIIREAIWTQKTMEYIVERHKTEMLPVLVENYGPQVYSLNEQQLNEFLGIGKLLSGGIDFLTGGMVRSVKEKLGKLVLGALGIEQGGVLGDLFVNILKNMGAKDVYNMVRGDDACDTAADIFMKALSETLIDKLGAVLGYTPGGVFDKLAGNSLKGALLDNQELTAGLSKKFCELDFKKIIGGGDSEAAKAAAEGGESESA